MEKRTGGGVISELKDRFQAHSPPNGHFIRPPRKPSIGKVTRGIEKETLTCTACSFRFSNSLREWMLFAAEQTFHDPRQLGRALGLNEGTIADVMRDFPGNSLEERTQMLVWWIKDRGEKATPQSLIETILSSDAGCLDDAFTAELLCQKLKELEPQIKKSKEQKASRSDGSATSTAGWHAGQASRQSSVPKRTSEAWHRLLLYASSEVFQLDTVTKRINVHSQEIKADREKLQRLESEVSQLRDQTHQLKLEIQNADLRKELQKMQYTFASTVQGLERKIEDLRQTMEKLTCRAQLGSKGEKAATPGSDCNPRTGHAKPIPSPRSRPRPSQHKCVSVQAYHAGTATTTDCVPKTEFEATTAKKLYYSYEDLLKVAKGVQKVYPKEIDRAHLEDYLSEAEFMEVFGMTHQEFQTKPKWRQGALKRQAKLF